MVMGFVGTFERYTLMNCYLVDTLALKSFWRGHNFWVMKHLTLNQHLKPQLFAWIGERWEISNRLVREICKIGWKFKVLTTTQLSSLCCGGLNIVNTKMQDFLQKMNKKIMFSQTLESLLNLKQMYLKKIGSYVMS